MHPALVILLGALTYLVAEDAAVFVAVFVVTFKIMNYSVYMYVKA